MPYHKDDNVLIIYDAAISNALCIFFVSLVVQYIYTALRKPEIDGLASTPCDVAVIE